MTKRAILYTRVSTDEQAMHGYSLRDQYEKLKSYCAQNDIEVVAHFQDDHSAKTFNRPEFIKLLDFAKRNQNKVDILLFIKWDRFSRNAPNSYEMIGLLRKYNIEPQAMEQPIDLSVPESKIMLAIYLTSPEVENDRRSMNVSNGIRRAMKEGRWVSKAPRGYDNKRDENNRPVILQGKDAIFVQEAFDLVATGDYTLEEVRRRLLLKGFKCQKSNFPLLLRNPIYIGQIRIRNKEGDLEEIVKGAHKGIITEEVFYTVQDVLEGKRVKCNMAAIHTPKPELPLRGFLICPRCGSKLTGSASKGNGGRYYYYHCLHGCKERFRASYANEKFAEYLSNFTFDKNVKELYNSILKSTLEENEVSRKDNIKVIDQEITKLQDRITNLQDKFADNQLNFEDYNTMKLRYESQLRDLKTKKQDAIYLSKEVYDQLIFSFSFLENLPSQYSKGTLDVQQRIIGSIFPENLTFSENQYRTKRINEVVKLFCAITNGFDRNKKGQFRSKSELSNKVENIGLEPITFWLPAKRSSQMS